VLRGARVNTDLWISLDLLSRRRKSPRRQRLGRMKVGKRQDRLPSDQADCVSGSPFGRNWVGTG